MDFAFLVWCVLPPVLSGRFWGRCNDISTISYFDGNSHAKLMDNHSLVSTLINKDAQYTLTQEIKNKAVHAKSSLHK